MKINIRYRSRIFLMFGFSALLKLTVTCQIDTLRSIYKKLEVKKYYLVSTSFDIRDGQATYLVNKEKVSKKIYDSYNTYLKNMNACKPCLLNIYDRHDILMSTGVQYTDCRVGFWIEYFKNGKVKLIGRYKENPTDNWNDIFERGYCSVKEGTWLYYDDKENLIKTEKYMNGKLIE